MRLTPLIASSYRLLWTTLRVRPERAAEVNAVIARCERHRGVYEDVEVRTGVPWEVVAAIHQLEKSGRFDGHLHNGDPLTARTVHVPQGRPKEGNPPFTWQESAEDALMNCPPFLARNDDWSVAGTLWALEKYNGLGYRRYHPEVLSPYLWAGSNHYSKGKYDRDGHFDPNLVSKQIGAAVILKSLNAGRWS